MIEYRLINLDAWCVAGIVGDDAIRWKREHPDRYRLEWREITPWVEEVGDRERSN